MSERDGSASVRLLTARAANAAVIAALDDAAQAVAAAKARLLALLAEGGGAAADADEWPTFADDPDLISTEEAARRACRGQDAIREWCVKHGIGRTYGSRYRISVRRLRRHLDRS